MDKQVVNRFYCMAESTRKIFFDNCHIGGMSRSEFSMLHLIELCKKELDVVTTALLSEQLQISKPAVSQMINVLEEKKYITREINKNDKRLKSISLTELGNQRLEEDKDRFLSKINIILDKMGREDSEVFIDSMEKFFGIVKEIKKK